MRYIFLLVLLGLSIAAFMLVVKPKYQQARELQQKILSDSTNLTTADKIKESREALIATYNNIPKADLDNLKMLLPDNVDNIRLIIQIDSLATKNGLSTVRNVEYQTEAKPTTGQSPESARRPYGEFTISFSTSGSYQNFLTFLSDLEANLRLVDITKVEFQQLGTNQVATSMNYRITIKTYWLKQ